MAAKGRAIVYLRSAMIFLALLLPMLSLLPLGWLWLWERGIALYWVIGAFAIGAIAYATQAITLRRTLRQTPVRADEIDKVAPDPSWTAREQAAWTAVESIAADVQPSELHRSRPIPQSRPAEHRSGRSPDPSRGQQSTLEVYHPRGAGTGRARQRRFAPLRHRQYSARRSADRRTSAQDIRLAVGNRHGRKGLRHLASHSSRQSRHRRGPGGARADHQTPLCQCARSACASARTRLRARGGARGYRSVWWAPARIRSGARDPRQRLHAPRPEPGEPSGGAVAHPRRGAGGGRKIEFRQRTLQRSTRGCRCARWHARLPGIRGRARRVSPAPW